MAAATNTSVFAKDGISGANYRKGEVSMRKTLIILLTLTMSIFLFSCRKNQETPLKVDGGNMETAKDLSQEIELKGSNNSNVEKEDEEDSDSSKIVETGQKSGNSSKPVETGQKSGNSSKPVETGQKGGNSSKPVEAEPKNSSSLDMEKEDKKDSDSSDVLKSEAPSDKDMEIFNAYIEKNPSKNKDEDIQKELAEEFDMTPEEIKEAYLRVWQHKLEQVQ
jgi:hypothetical protein